MTTVKHLFEPLIIWYERNGRSLPWRLRSAKPDPYSVWLAEIMSQQTVIKALIPYYHRFLQRWPKIENLADAPLDEVLSLWAGLGYYRRAHNLHKTANIIAYDYKGLWPEDYKALLKLPGVGAYTAAAIASIAFNAPRLAIDGNLKRVLSRYGNHDSPPQKLESVLRLTYEKDMAACEQPGDINQALMDLAANICRPQAPSCPVCPLNNTCKAYSLDRISFLPQKPAKKARPERSGRAFIVDNCGAILMRKGTADLLSGLWEVPTSCWADSEDIGSLSFPQTLTSFCLGHSKEKVMEGKVTSLGLNWQTCGAITHTFTHFHLKLTVFSAHINHQPALPDGLIWADEAKRKTLGISTLMKKVIARYKLQSDK